MKKRVKIFISCIVTLSLIIGVVYYLGNLVRPVTTDVALNAIETFHNMPEDSIEVIGYGSSHMWRGVNVMEMYDKYGIGAYNYGCNWQHMNTTSLFFKDSLRTQSPKVVVIDTFLVNDLLQNINMEGEIYYTRGISNFDGKREYLKQCFGDNKERYLSYYMPLCAFHDNWVNLEERSFFKNADDTDFYKTMGYWYMEEVTPVTLDDPATFEQLELSEEALKILDDIVETCNEKDIDIIFITVPYMGSYAYGDAMTRYAQENGCQYFNMFEMIDEIGFDCNTDFRDSGHLNNSGAVKVADFLGEYIVNNYDVSDMRMEEGNLWEQAELR